MEKLLKSRTFLKNEVNKKYIPEVRLSKDFLTGQRKHNQKRKKINKLYLMRLKLLIKRQLTI